MNTAAHIALIETMGDTAIVADRYNVEKQTVSGWKTRGIPLRILLNMLKDAKREKKKIPKEFKSLFI